MGGPGRFLTLQQVAEELNTELSTVRALIASGELPAIQIGGRGQWRIERIKLEDYITAAYAKTRTDIAHGDVDFDRRFSVDPSAPFDPSGVSR